MPKDLEQLREELKTSNETIQELASVVSTPEATAEQIEKFDAAMAKFNEAKAEYDSEKARFETSEAATDRKRRAEEIADYTKKFETDTIRNPNYNRQTAKAAQRYSREPEILSRDLDHACAIWARGHLVADIDSAELDLCKRLNVNPAASIFEPKQFFDSRAFNEYFGSSLGRLGSRASFNGSGFTAGPTTYADSRDDTVLGLTNKPPQFLATIANNFVTYGGIMKAPISMESVDHLSDITETYVSDLNTGRQIGEGQTIGTNINPTDGQLTWKAWKFTSDDIVVSQEQLIQSRMELPTWIGEALGERLGRRASIELSNGTGTVRPYGIVPAVTAGGKFATAAAAAAIDFPDIRKLIFAIDEIWRTGPGVGFMMSEVNLVYLMGLKDAVSGLPTFMWGKEGASSVRTLEGYPVFINREMITTHATTQKPILFGDFSRFKVIFRGSMMPRLIRDDTTGRREEKVYFTALQSYDSLLRDYGNCPIAELRMA